MYQEGKDDDATDDGEALLPAIKEGEALATRTIDAEQHFTQPPPRFTEATLVKALEEYGIGRPSTYASIIATLQDRGYVRLEQKRFFPEDVGRIVSKFLTEHFGQYVDYGFTAAMEDDLDAIARGEHDWKPTLRKFWQPFKAQADEKMDSVSKPDVTTEATGESCPTCQIGELVYRLGRYGRFKGCNRYPECNYIEKTGPAAAPGESTGIACPSCKADDAVLMKKTSRLGKIFWSCSTYPTCTYAIWDEPTNQPCPSCGWGCVGTKVSKKYGEWHRCRNPSAIGTTTKRRPMPLRPLGPALPRARLLKRVAKLPPKLLKRQQKQWLNLNPWQKRQQLKPSLPPKKPLLKPKRL